MSDNLFDRLFELLQSPGPVNWRLAREVLGSVAGPHEVIEPRLAEEYAELTLAAELRAADTPGLTVASGDTLHPVDRATWAKENEQSFRFLFEPLAGRLLAMDAGPVSAIMHQLTPALLGMQAGTLVGLMSHDTLGQFDAGLPALDHDRRYLVVPNVEAFAASFDLDPQQVRLWAATREVVHHAIVGVPWLRGHTVAIVEAYFDGLELDPSRLMERLGELQDPARIEEALGGDTGLPGLLGGTPDPGRHDAIVALLAFLDGYGAWAAQRALHGMIPDLDRIASLASGRTSEPSPASQALAQLAGIQLDEDHVAAAARFTDEVARRWGDEAVARVWESAPGLPTLGELSDPVGWAARVLI